MLWLGEDDVVEVVDATFAVTEAAGERVLEDVVVVIVVDVCGVEVVWVEMVRKEV